jgi:pimeloyl-ACP methyl ester carboxylesterase
MSETHPLVFGVRTELHGVLHLPGSIAASAGGAVVCAPLLHPNITSYRPLRTLARRLAEEGRPVLRFDWPGCGDSADPAELGLSAWMGAVHDAVSALREETGVEEVALVGLRIGATIGLAAALEEPAVSELVLLAPFPSGRAYLRELSAFQSLSQDASQEMDGPTPALPEGSVEASGFLLWPQEVEALEALDLSSLDLSPLAARRALLVTMQADRKVTALAEQLRAAGVAVANVVEGELSRVLDDTNRSVWPPSCAELVGGWLQASSNPPSPGRVPERNGRRRAVITLDTGGEVTREEAVVISTERGALVGVTCEPSGVESESAWVVFLNAARVRKVGPNRLWTSYARHWARSGVQSFRFDVSGVGDSGGTDVPTDADEAYYRPGLVADTLDVLEWLAENKGADRFALVGLCSGATWAFSAALQNERVAALALVNPRVLFWDDRAKPLKAWGEAREIARDPRRWSSLLRRGVRRWAADAARGALLSLRGRGDDTWHRQEILSSISRLSARGTTTLCVFSEGDLGIQYFERHLGPGYSSVLAAKGATVEVIRGPDHTFRPLWSHDVLRRTLERALLGSDVLSPSAVDAPEPADAAAS